MLKVTLPLWQFFVSLHRVLAIMRRTWRNILPLWLLLLAVACGIVPARAELFNLDSIAAKGKVLRWGVDVYRWGDQFFNGYDTLYVEPTHYKFNVKLKTDSWIENNTFRFENNKYQMNMYSHPSTQTGLYLTYMAVSVGYDINMSKLLGLTHSSRKRFNFQFNCMLFAADFNLQSTNSRMRINRIGPKGDMQKVDIPFDNQHGREWSLDLYYFFNHKHYSQAAAFSYSRIQRRSSGSLFAGLSFSGQSLNFDFRDLPADIIEEIPASWPDYTYHVHAHNYAFKLGYGYNIVCSRRCIVGLSEAPYLGVRYGYINDPSDAHTTFYAFNRFRASFIWNRRHWYAGIIAQLDTNLFSNKDHALITNLISAEVSVGYRFNLW